MSNDKNDEIDAVSAGAMSFEPFANLPFPVTQEKVRAALLAGDELGQAVVADLGDAAYRELQA
jgi:hypothetical protein